MRLSDVAEPTTHPLVLVVDRDADTRSMYAEYLTHAGWNTAEAENGRDALAKAISQRPSVVVTDTRLEFIDGYQLCRFLRHDAETAGITIIVITGEVYPANVRRAQLAGAEIVLTKPCLPERLEREIRKVTGNGGHQFTEPPEPEGVQPVDGRAIDAAEPRRSLVRAHQRHETSKPPLRPPALLCPSCDRALTYDRSHIGGVSERHPEQWDYFECGSCGTFQYRQRTRKLRRVQ